MTVAQILGEGSIVFAVGLTVVFAILAFLILVIDINSKIVHAIEGKKKPTPLTSEPKEVVSQSIVSAETTDEEDEELVAVITAAVMAIFAGSNSSSDIRVKAIRRTGRTSPAWNVAGRDEYLATRL